MNSLQKLFYSCKEIGIPRLTEFAVYQAQKKSGRIKNLTPINGVSPDFDLQGFEPNFFLPDLSLMLFDHLREHRSSILVKAEEVVNGEYRPFSGNKEFLKFAKPDAPYAHWSNYGDTLNGMDVKRVWEPARFSWALDLARAYLISRDNQYAGFFWDQFTAFEDANPVNCGPNWASAQECAMRILTWGMVYPILQDSPASTDDLKHRFFTSIWQHAARIPPTLTYARSQNNNHLLSEALGLIAAGALFASQSCRAAGWLELGWREFCAGLLKQIEPDGTYAQHSANYHRLMLQLSLIFYTYAQRLNRKIPEAVTQKLAAATRWVTAQLDAQTGRLPNLGHNDGTLLLPMGYVDFRDYRPTAQAASRAFLGEPCLPPGAWDELSLWLGLPCDQKITNPSTFNSPAIHQVAGRNCRAILRGVRFHGRPAHADQLHLDVWWDGVNILQDAGTYVYNDAPPWQNAFCTTRVHNTLVVNDKDQMEQAGKFLWLNQANAKWLPSEDDASLCARHDGYRRLGILHQRSVEFLSDDHLRINDLVSQKKPVENLVRIHWLLSDWEWEMDRQSLHLHKGNHTLRIMLNALAVDSKVQIRPLELGLIRAGKTVYGTYHNEIMGWVSETYREKSPALSFFAQYQISSDMQIITDMVFSTTPQKREK